MASSFNKLKEHHFLACVIASAQDTRLPTMRSAGMRTFTSRSASRAMSTIAAMSAISETSVAPSGSISQAYERPQMTSIRVCKECTSMHEFDRRIITLAPTNIAVVDLDEAAEGAKEVSKGGCVCRLGLAAEDIRGAPRSVAKHRKRYATVWLLSNLGSLL